MNKLLLIKINDSFNINKQFDLKKMLVFVVTIFFLSCNLHHSGNKEYMPTYFTDTNKQQEIFQIGISPFYSTVELSKKFDPILKCLSKNIPEVTFRFVGSLSYQNFEDRLKAGYFNMVFSTPSEAIAASEEGYTIFGKMAENGHSKGVLLVRKDAGINLISDLKGKTICFPAPTAFVGTMMTKYYLQTHGLDVNKDIKRIYSNSLESSILNVYLGRCSAAGSALNTWKSFCVQEPVFADKLKIQWETPSTLNIAILARNDIKKELLDKISTILFTLQNTSEGRKILDSIPLSNFEEANLNTYKPVSEFLKKYDSLKIRQ